MSEELKSKLTELATKTGCFPPQSDEEVIELMQAAYDMAKSDEWVSVADRLPETDERNESEVYLCLDYMDNYFTGWYNSETKYWHSAVYNSDNSNMGVTHWHPLPKAPNQ